MTKFKNQQKYNSFITLNIDNNPYITCIIKSINHARTLECRYHLYIP